MIINNFNYLEKYFDILKFKDDFYFVQLYQRKKDGHNLNKDKNVLESFYFYTKEEFLNAKNKIIKLCQENNARAYFWINPRNNKQVALNCIKTLTELVIANECKSGFKTWIKQCGLTPSSDYDRLWIVDLNNKEELFRLQIINLIKSCYSKFDNNIVDIIPTMNGYHLITHPFDIMYFNTLCIFNNIEKIDIHKNNSTLLYYEQN